MGGFSLWHWLVVVILVLLLFGKGRISDMMGDLGKGLKSFKQGMGDDEEQKRSEAQRASDRHSGDPRQIPGERPIDITPQQPRDETVAPPPPRADDTRS